MDRKEAFLRSALIAPDERPLLLAAAAAPAGDPTALIYADWLEEHGGPEATARAELLRARHKLATSKWRKRLRTRVEKLRAEAAPAWLSIIGDIRERLLERWREIAARLIAEYPYARPDAVEAFTVTADQGLLAVRYDAKKHDWQCQDGFPLLTGREVAPVLPELRMVGNGGAGNGVRGCLDR